MTNKKVLTGLTFGKLTVIRQAPTHKTPGGTKVTCWLCECICGNMIVVGSQKLRKGHTKSCGCWANNFISEANSKHGMAHSPTYNSWSGMIQRCTNVKNPNWPHYGGRGITVCERWLKFENFYEDIGTKPDGLELDRIDVNGNYCKENCKWSTRTEQCKNRRNRKEYTVHGITGSIRELASHFGIDSTVVAARLRHKRKHREWSVEEAFTTPLM